MEASLAGVAAERVYFVGSENLEVVNLDRTAVRAGVAEARKFRGFVKVHRHLAFTEKTRGTGWSRRTLGTAEPRCPERDCITKSRTLQVLAGALHRDGSRKSPGRAAEQHTVTVPYAIKATAAVRLHEDSTHRIG